LTDMGHALKSVPTAVIVLSSASFCANLLIKAWRWQRLLVAQGIVIPNRVALASFLSGQFYGQVTLGRVGEFVRVEALLERDVSAGAALSSCVFDRLIDLFIVLSAGAILSAWVLGNKQVALAALVMMVVGGLAVTAVITLITSDGDKAPNNFASRFMDALGQKRALTKIVKATRELAQGMRPMLRPITLLEAVGWSVLGWTGYFAALWQLAEGLGIGVSRILLTATASFAALSALLPVTISGLGARELIYIQVLQSQGVPNERAVVLSLLHLFVMSISATILGFGGVLWRQRQRLK
jgi:glycosyltransferase 2 family protein